MVKLANWHVAPTMAGATCLALLFAGCSVPSESPEPNPTSTVADSDWGNWASNMENCLKEAGWDVNVSPDGSVGITLPESQQTAYDADHKTCEKSFGYDKEPVHTEEQFRALYPRMLETVECIRSEGFDPGTPPSEEAYVDQMLGDGGWDPYGAIYPDVVQEDGYYELLQKCPRAEVWNE